MRRWKTLTVVAALAGVLAGCGANEPASTPGTSGTADAAGQAPIKIIVGTGTQFPNVCFLDENGKLTGYDVELVREIDKRLDDYEFEFQTLEFTNLLLSLETKKIDMVAHQMEQNAERQEKYLFNKVPYAHWKNKVAVAATNDTVQSIDDLKGKKVLTTATSAQAIILEKYNAEHDNAIDIVYQNGAANDTIQQVVSGRAEAFLSADFTLPLIDTNHELKLVGPALSESNTLFMFRQNDPEQQALADRIDEALQEIKADGTLKQLSEQWLGADYTSSELAS
ncbi:transporter substrate-binding domain-containing protein [Paenibacillus sp. 598K]|uniref:transporter substrate-binding domain-containing protein n=1 Tax=Paenibacillus sp. 598K TaxID=1117987 RepID=UPI000FFE49A3|nr:transporter substrate-binding domain-containing protein [Paenibacillus sp. 598K]